MTAFVGRSGADAIFALLHRCCIVVQRYSGKLNNAIDLAQAAALITSEQQTAAKAFVTGVDSLCEVFRLVASNSGF